MGTWGNVGLSEGGGWEGNGAGVSSPGPPRRTHLAGDALKLVKRGRAVLLEKLRLFGGNLSVLAGGAGQEAREGR